MTIVLGAIADDFTGATDLANNLVRGGMRCLQVIGVPQQALDLANVDAGGGGAEVALLPGGRGRRRLTGGPLLAT